MTNLLITIFAYLIICSNATPILQITDANQNEIFKSNGGFLITITASWCLKSSALKSEFNETIEQLTSLLKTFSTGSPQIDFGNIDGPTNPALLNRFSVISYPTILLVTDAGRKADSFVGDRTAEAIVNWVLHILNPTIKQISNSDLTLWTRYVKPLVVIETPEAKMSQMITQMTPFTLQRFLEATFVITTTSSSDQQSELTIYQDKDQTPVPTKMLLTSDYKSISKFLDDNFFPLVAKISLQNFADYVRLDKDLIWFVGNEKAYDLIKTNLFEIAKKKRSQIQILRLPSDQFRDHAWSSLGIFSTPALVFQSISRKEIYDYKDNIMEADQNMIDAFISDCMNKKIAKKFRSETPSQSRITALLEGDIEKRFVKRTVSDELQNQIYSTQKDLVLGILAPWGKSNYQMENMMENISELMQTGQLKDEVEILKVNGAANDLKFLNFDIQKFPTAIYISQGKVISPPYSGPLTIYAFTQFILRHLNRHVTVIA